MRVRYLCLISTVAVTLFASSPALAGGHDFIDEARLFYRVVACGGDAAIPASFDHDLVDEHCKAINKSMALYRRRFVKRTAKFFAKILPTSLPRQVVYPFGGGDLGGALATYPDATEITSISLEHPGDPRRLAVLDNKQLAASLALYRLVGGRLMKWNDNASKNLRKMEKGPIPGQLALFMQALVVHGYEPVSLKYFRIEQDGSIRYLSTADIDALDGKHSERLDPRWVNTDYSVAFRNMELSFRRVGGGANAPIIVHRHIAYNLDNDHFGGSPLQKHLERKGKIAAMTKAASYLLWINEFKMIRDYLLAHMAYMVSDSTGVLPRHARRAGFEQITYGTFTGAYLEYKRGKSSDLMQKLWEDQRSRSLPFRYGYPDAEGNYHMMLTRPKPTQARRDKRTRK